MGEISKFNTGSEIFDLKDATARQSLAQKQDVLSFDASPTSGSTNPVTSGGVSSALDGKANGSGMSLSVNADGTLRVSYNDGQ